MSRLFGVALADIFAGCASWQMVLLGGDAVDGVPRGKAELGAACRMLRSHMADRCVKHIEDSTGQYIFPHIANLFGCMRYFELADLRLIIVGDYSVSNSGLAYMGGRAPAGAPADMRIWAAAGILLINRSLTCNARVLHHEGLARLDPQGGYEPHTFWNNYVDGVLARIVAAHPVPVVYLHEAGVYCRGAIRGTLRGSAEALSRLVGPAAEVLTCTVPYRRALFFATDGSCTGNGKAHAAASWGVYAPELYAGVPNAAVGLAPKRGQVPKYEWIWNASRHRGEVTGDSAAAPSNNRAEMIAFIVAIEAAIDYTLAHPHHGLPLHIVCDSDYTIGTAVSWCWGKAADDFAACAANRDLVRVLYWTMVRYAELLRPGCGGAGARAVLFAPWQSLYVPGGGSRDTEPFSWPGITVFIQRSHRALPPAGGTWLDALPYDRAHANAIADSYASQPEVVETYDIGKQ